MMTANDENIFDSLIENVVGTPSKKYVCVCIYIYIYIYIYIHYNIINKAFHNTRLHGPVPNPSQQNHILPFISTYSSIYTNKEIA